MTHPRVGAGGVARDWQDRGMMAREDECAVCNGSGRVGTADENHPCVVCQGTGYRINHPDPDDHGLQYGPRP